MLALNATGLKTSLVRSISFSAISDSARRILISSEVAFDSSKTWISSSSSRMSAIFSFLVKPFKILSSHSTSAFAPYAFYCTMLSFFFWSSGISRPTNVFNIYSSRPNGVIAKFNIVTLTEVSGE